MDLPERCESCESKVWQCCKAFSFSHCPWDGSIERPLKMRDAYYAALTEPKKQMQEYFMNEYPEVKDSD